MEYEPGPAGSGDINDEVVLPTDNWQTKIIEKKIIEGDDNCSNVQVHFFVNIRNKEDFKKWLVEFEDLTDSSYVIRCTDSEDGVKVKLKQRLVCHHYTRCKETYSPSLKKFTRNTKCPSRLVVTIHVIKKKYQGKNENYDLIRQMPCEIILIANHNHSTGTPDSLKFRRVSPSVREKLINLYQSGHTPGTALEMIKCQIQLSNDNCTTALADRNQCPSYTYCYYLYKTEFKQQCDALEHNVTAKILLQNTLKLYNDKHADSCAKMVFMGQEHANYVIGICTPIMKRVHQYIENASNIVFMDSTSTVDRDGRLFVLLTDSECGALPLGLIITNSESVEAIKCGLQILTDLLGQDIFGGHKEGPKVFMTNDSLTEQKAIREMWPQVKCLLCTIHVLQAVWRWLSKLKNGIPKEQRTQIYKDFRNILYSETIDEMFQKYELAVVNAKMYRNYLNYINDHWWPKKESWVKAYRHSFLIHNDHTNNYSEATIRQIKEQVFSRIKTFNAVQMVDFMITKYEDYNERKLLDGLSNRLNENPLNKEVNMPSTEILQRIVKLDESIIAVPSETNQNLMFLVNMEILTCSCIQGLLGSICKHIDWANMVYGNDKSTVTIDNYQVRQKLHFIATGQPLEEDDDDEHSSEINNGENAMENEYDEIKEKFEDAMKKICLIFHNNFEKSPGQVTASVEKMVGTLEKIKTPTAFASAVATIGSGIGQKRKGGPTPVQAVVQRKIKKQEAIPVAATEHPYTIPVSNLINAQQVKTVGSLRGLGNIQLSNLQAIPTIQNIPGLGNVQVISQQQPQISVGPRQQVIQRDPNDPTKWQIIPQVIITAAPQPNQILPLISESTVESSPAPCPSVSDQNRGEQKQKVRNPCTCRNCQEDTHPNGRKQHICHMPRCNKVYGKTSHLRDHLRLHLHPTGQRPFLCTWFDCGKRFTRSYDLKRHRWIHTRPMNNFRRRSERLSKHLKTQQDQRLTQDEDQDDHEVLDVQDDSEPQKESEFNSEPLWITDSENDVKYAITHLSDSEKPATSTQQLASSDNSSNEEEIIIIVDRFDS